MGDARLSSYLLRIMVSEVMLLPAQTGRRWSRALPAQALLARVVFRLLMYQQLVLVGDRRLVPERKSK